MTAKRLIGLAGALATLLLAASMAGVGATPADAAAKANPRKGKVFYKKNCRVCHDGSTDAEELSPISKTMKQWTREFEEGEVVRTECVQRVKDTVGTELTEQDLIDIQAYLVRHAADSDQPATCGN
jgi:cytochrome c